MKLMFFILFAFCAFNVNASTQSNVRYVYVTLDDAHQLLYQVDGKELHAEDLPGYFASRRAAWPKDRVELRLVFRSDVTLQLFQLGYRQLRIRGFKHIRCFSGAIGTGKASEIKEVGTLIVLPEDAWK